MNLRKMIGSLLVILAATLTFTIVEAQGPQGGRRAPAANAGTAFTYQGQLKQSGALVNATCSFNFGLWDSATLGTQVGTTQTVSSVSVTSGLFTTPIDFGASRFTGEARWLGIAVNCGSGLTTLNPRQPLDPAPMAFALPGLYTQQNATSPNIIGGYSGNTIITSSHGSVIGGGGLATSVNSIDGNYSTIAGGSRNSIGSADSVIGGGFNNTITGHEAVISGGGTNSSGGEHAAIGGGINNIADADNSFIAGGDSNRTSGGGYSFAAGRNAKADHTGTFVWSDSFTTTDFASTGVDQFLIRAEGGVGIGTNSPATQLHVVSSFNGTGTNPGDNVAVIENTNTNNSADVLALKIGGTGNPATSNNFITFLLGNNTSAGAIQGNGTGSVELAGAGNDYAEYLPRASAIEPLEPGDIVGVAGGRVSRTTRGATQLMVVSDHAIVAGNDPGESERDRFALVAFVGQVPTRVRGIVQTGDFIIPSGSEDGVGRAISPAAITSDQFGQVVGVAWGGAVDPNVKLVNVAVGLPRSDPTIQRLVKQNEDLQARVAALEESLKQNSVSARAASTIPPIPWLWFGGIFLGGVVLWRFNPGDKR